jgi:hypothetical protein
LYSGLDQLILEDNSLSKAEKRDKLALARELRYSDYQIEQEEREERRSAQFIKADSKPLEPAKVEPVFPERVKVWAMVGLSAIKGNHGGAWRAWSLARALDDRGSGWVEKRHLWDFFAFLGLKVRQRQRWIKDAREIGLLIVPKEPKKRGRDYKEPKKISRYYLAGLARGAAALGAETIGKPAEIKAIHLVREGVKKKNGVSPEAGWRSYVWAAYLSTLQTRKDYYLVKVGGEKKFVTKKIKFRLVSQNTRKDETGISPRVQRYWERYLALKKKRNFAVWNIPNDRKTGFLEFGGKYFQDSYGRILQRLPNQIIVPETVALRAPRGSSRKAQGLLCKFSSLSRWENNVENQRLFFETVDDAGEALFRYRRADFTPEQIGETFVLASSRWEVNLWHPVL